MKRALLALCLLTGGCSWIGDTADSLGSHLPTIGERCEHWQCFTSGGREISRANKEAVEEQKRQTAEEAAKMQQPATPQHVNPGPGTRTLMPRQAQARPDPQPPVTEASPYPAQTRALAH